MQGNGTAEVNPEAGRVRRQAQKKLPTGIGSRTQQNSGSVVAETISAEAAKARWGGTCHPATEAERETVEARQHTFPAPTRTLRWIYLPATAPPSVKP